MFKCDLCLKEFSTKPRLNRHIIQKICNPNEYICKTCNMKYDKYKSYWMHINRGCALANTVKETDVKNVTNVKGITDMKNTNILTDEFIKSISETVNLLSLEINEIKKINLEFMKFVNLELNQIHLKIDNSLIK